MEALQQQLEQRRQQSMNLEQPPAQSETSSAQSIVAPSSPSVTTSSATTASTPQSTAAETVDGSDILALKESNRALSSMVDELKKSLSTQQEKASVDKKNASNTLKGFVTQSTQVQQMLNTALQEERVRNDDLSKKLATVMEQVSMLDSKLNAAQTEAVMKAARCAAVEEELKRADGVLTAREGDLKTLSKAVKTLQADMASVASANSTPRDSTNAVSLAASADGTGVEDMQNVVAGLKQELATLTSASSPAIVQLRNEMSSLAQTVN